MEDQQLFPDRETFRQWLLKNHDSNQGIWLVFSKTKEIKSIKPDEALEEALCFGWIDGLIKRVDDQRYLKKFTPRRKRSNWSPFNQKLVKKLIENGRMTEYGMKTIEEAKKSGTWEMGKSRPAVSDGQIETLVKAINGAEPALTNYLKMPLSVRKTYAYAYLEAKQESTRISRLKKIIQRLNENKKPM
jgi:uncharacterized protein YdeI (YjbR/CyaY-like superfamily)